MNKQSKKVEIGVIQYAALENNRAYLLRTEITKSHPNNHICLHCGARTSTATPLVLLRFLISPCLVTTAYQVSSEIHGGFFYYVACM